jgi:hypothetical protein
MADFYAYAPWSEVNTPPPVDNMSRASRLRVWRDKITKGWEGAQLFRQTVDPEGYPAGVYLEGWLAIDAEQGEFDFPVTASGAPDGKA